MTLRFLKTSLLGTLGLVAVAALVASSPLALGAARNAASTQRTAKTGVVVVSTTLAYGGSAAGTGIVLTSSGAVLTNNHVIRGAKSLQVTDTSTGRTYRAVVVGYSVPKDIALLQLRNASGLSTALLGTSSNLRVGDRVTAVGNAGGTGSLTTKSGRLVRLGRTITVTDEDGSSTRLTGLIETSAVLEPGDSGGPLLRQGHVIGVDAAAASSFRFTGGGEGYAIPIDTALTIAGKIETGRASATVHIGPTAFLGVALAPEGYAQDVSGALVEGVSQGSPADVAGIGADDVITSFAGKPVRSAAALKRLVLRFAPGRVVRVTWLDQFTGKNVATVRLASGPPQ
jgi:S1-C subfamily serine protease